MNLVEDLKWRGLLYQVTDEDVLQKLNEGKLTFYLGADPTADSLHIGHLLAYLVAKRLMEKGNQPILVIGGGTGLVGDPSFKKSERSLLTIEESLKNAEGIKKQVVKILPTAKIVNNYDWISSLNAIEFLRDVGKNFNVTYMMNKDSVKSRIENGISFTEFAYQILQAWDFEYLFKNHGCSLQIGGQDQWGNITAGLELIRKVHSSEVNAYGLTFPLVTKSDGTKFGKTESGAVWLDKEKTSPYEFYQYWINTADDDVILRLKQFTFLSKEEIEALEVEVNGSPEERVAQKVLAEKVTELVHGATELDKAIKVTNALFSGNIKDLEVDEIEMGFKGLTTVESNEELSLMDALIAVELVKSRREAREMISNGAVSVNGDKVQDLDFVLKSANAFGKKYSILKKGKKRYALVKHL
ncbi:MAG: tyrosine--tRNA ligase [Tenericutes bacterium]|nr:tyrosine--tRNA ligase [Mycoplasmatota bacterium]